MEHTAHLNIVLLQGIFLVLFLDKVTTAVTLAETDLAIKGVDSNADSRFRL